MCYNKVHTIINTGDKIMIKTKLRELRIKKGVSQQDMADYLNVKRPTYTRYESGTNEPDLKAVILLADYFGVTVDYLLDREPPAVCNEKSSSKSDELNEKERIMLQMFRSSSEEFQDQFLSLFEIALKERALIQ